jgi:hypothetical protein
MNGGEQGDMSNHCSFLHHRNGAEWIPGCHVGRLDSRGDGTS